MELLLEADPSIGKILHSLAGAQCFVAQIDEAVVGVYVLKETVPAKYELMNISVAPSRQRRGIGKALLEHAIARVREGAGLRLEVGTASFGYYLTFYQRAGFRVSSVEKDFFLENYPEPLYEDGIRHTDMLRLTLDLSKGKIAT